MKAKKVGLNLFAFLAVLSLMACNLPTGQSASTPDINGTVAAQVAIEQAAQTLVAATLAANGQANNPTATNTVQAQPLDTSTPTFTPTITLTPTPEGVFLVLSADTHCRKGAPFSAFPIIITVKAGEKVKVLSRNPENDSYFVINPYDPNSKCWLYGKYATLSGDSASLPVSTMQATPTFTPTPTPVPDFAVSYVGLETCGLEWAFKLFIKNTGGKVWQSISITGSDSVTGFVISHSSNSFKEYAGCVVGLTQGDLTPGEESYVLNVSPGQFPYNPTGNNIVINVKLCTQDGLLGECASKVISFTP